MRTALISRLFLVGMLFVHTLAFAAGGSGQSSTISNQGAVKAQGVTLSGHVIPAVKALPEKRFSADSILVRFKKGASVNDKAVGRQMIKGKQLRAYHLVQGLEHLSIGIPGLEVEDAIKILDRLPFVEYAQPNHVISINVIPNDAQFDEQWALYNIGQSSAFGEFGVGTIGADIGATDAWDTISSSSQPVAIIDTGIGYDHPDLVNNIWTNPGEIPGNGLDDDGNGYVDDVHGWDFANNDNDPYDGLGHGTHVAGIVAAQGNDGVSVPNFGGLGIDAGVCGVLWQGQLMALKAIGDDGWGYLSHAIEALEYAVNNGAGISNNSWGYYEYPGEELEHQALYDTILAVQADNHLFIAAAGNGDNQGSNGLDTDVTAHYPSSFDLDNIISVAASDNNDNLAYFSNYGLETVDLAAPGVGVYSTHIYPYLLWIDYAWFSGTSMAAPHVSGVVAMVTEQHPDWTFSQIRSRVLSTVRPLDALAGKTVTGGMLNAAAAVAGGTTPPTADFSYSSVDLTVTFSDLSVDTDGTIDGCDWNFNDGQYSNLQNPVHTYAGYGIYNVTLTVTDNDGATDSITKEVTVAEPDNISPIASFTYLCSGRDCDFDGSESSDSDGTIVYEWDFGDGYGAYIMNPSHSYAVDETYTVTLTVTDDDGATDTDTQHVTVTASSTCNNNGICEDGEDCTTCPNDCISGEGGGCGNGVCEPALGEDCLECPQDCRGKQVGTAKRQYCCGDGDGSNPVVCDDPRCTENGWLCSDTSSDPYCCGDGTCEGAEDYLNCAVDGCIAPYCGDGICDPDEQCSCSADCYTPPSSETNCSDGIDDDCDGKVDGVDPDCSCKIKGETCSSDTECCSGDCHPIKGTCK